MRKIISFGVLLFILLICPILQVNAKELNPLFEFSNNGDKNKIIDNSHSTSIKFQKNDTIIVKSSDNSLIYGLYISWDSEISDWKLITDSGELICGKNKFLHEYISLETPSHQLIITIPKDDTRIDNIRIFGEGELPHDIQVWNPPCEKADIMVVSSHADDEILFFGGALTLYAYEYDADIQVVYMCEFRSTGQKVREHEKLDGLWEAGIKNYPTCGNFYDKYSEDIKKALEQYNYEEMVEFLVSEIRRRKPQIIVTHDIYGEYGHGYHKLTCHAVLEAVELAAINNQFDESEINYGIWNTPKTYLHISKINPIKLNLRVKIDEDYADREVIDILKEAYKKHASQQGCWFYVSDDYKYSCAEFGLVRSLVGVDTENDLLCNLKTYKIQEIEEQERLQKEQAILKEQERLKKLEDEKLKKEQIAKKEQEKLLRENYNNLQIENENLRIEFENKINLQTEKEIKLNEELNIIKQLNKKLESENLSQKTEINILENKLNIILIINLIGVVVICAIIFILKINKKDY